MSYFEYYQKLALPPIPTKSEIINKYQQQELEDILCELIDEIDCKNLQAKLKKAIDNFVMFLTDKHDKLIDSFDTLDRSKKPFEHRLGTQENKSNREAQIYKSRFESDSHQNPTLKKRSTFASSNASVISGKSCITYSSSSRSSSSSFMKSSFKDESAESQFYDARSDNEFDVQSVLSDPDSSALPNSPYMTPLMSPLSLISPTQDHNEIISLRQEETPVLKYACGDGFWNTIARGKANKTEVETLIR